MKRKFTSDNVKILMDADILLSTVHSLNRCQELFIQSIERAISDGIPRRNVASLIGVCELLGFITNDFFDNYKACFDMEVELMKRNRQK